MHSSIFIALLASVAFTDAAPATNDRRQLDCAGKGAYYVCAANGFRGACSVDPCALSWCPDYESKTCSPVKTERPDKPAACAGKGAYYVCAANGFRGACSVDPCALNWCPDYEPKTCSPVKTERPDKPAACAGKGAYYVCAANGFRGACSVDPCALNWCPDYEPKTCSPPKTVTDSKKTVVQPECTGKGAYYVCAANGFRGACSVDPCALNWCPDYEPKTCSTPKTERRAEEPVTVPECTGKGAYYVCAANGFRGTCSVDPCALTWCPDYEVRTCEKHSWTPEPANEKTPVKSSGWTDPTVCAAGTGYYQSCSNGFKGCCKQDACHLGYCPEY